MKNTENNKKLYRRYLDDLYTTEDARQLLNSLHDPDNHETLNELSSDVWEETATQQPYTDLEREHYKREARQLLKHIEHKKRTWFHRIAVVTASTAAIVCLVLSGIHYLEHLNEQQIIYLEASTSYGERKQLLLPDGTQLTLNSCSHVRYPNNFTGEERKIVLEGEGYFEVKRNEKIPFFVKTKDLQLQVLGTKFNFRDYPEDHEVVVSLLEGKVGLNNLLREEKEAVLSPDERAVLNKANGLLTVESVTASNASQWTDGYLFFDEELLPDIAKELERSYNVKIHIANDSLKTFRFYGNFVRREQNIQEVLEALASTEKMQYKIEERNITIY